MNKKILLSLVFIAILGITACLVFFPKNTPEEPRDNVRKTNPVAFDPQNSTFVINGQTVTLYNGEAKTQLILDSNIKTVTKYFGNEAVGDLNNDGEDDIAFIVTQDDGGSGTFFYAVVAIKTLIGYKTTNAFPIGDRIAPQANQINSSAQELYVNFAERKPGEPMSAQPSVGATLYLKVTPDGVLEGLMK
jgi:hypothetical protein